MKVRANLLIAITRIGQMETMSSILNAEWLMAG